MQQQRGPEMRQNSPRLQLEVVSNDLLSPQTRSEVVALCTRAFEENYSPLLAPLHGAVHVLGRLGPKLVTHALWVTRWLQAGTKPIMRTAYVEAVATEQAYRRRGFATAVMKRLAQEIRAYDLGGLSPFSVAYYARLGWELWRGPLFIRTDDGLLPTLEAEDVMILRLPNTPDLDLDAPLSAEWREGELW
jgi:aminoglycoside 2'-N-acetyltransferase I